MVAAIVVAYFTYFLVAMGVATYLAKRERAAGIGFALFTAVLCLYWPVRLALHRPAYYWDGSSTEMNVSCECIMVLGVFGPIHLIVFVSALVALSHPPTAPGVPPEKPE